MDLFGLDKTIFYFFKGMSWEQGFQGLLIILMGVYVWSGVINKKVKRK